MTINQNCFLKLPDDRLIEPHHLPDKSTDLGVSNIMQALHYAPQHENYHFNWTQNNEFWTQWTDIPDIELPPSTFDIWAVFSKMFDPIEVTAFTGRTILIIVIVFLIFGIICYFSRDCFNWTKTWLLIRNPRKYWTENKGLYVPYFQKIPKMDDIVTNITSSPWRFSTWRAKFRPTPTNTTAATAEDREQAHDQELQQMFNSTASAPIVRNSPPPNRPTASFSAYPSLTPSASNTYVPAEMPEPMALHDTSALRVEDDWRTTAHQAALQLKAVNARP